MRNNSNREGFFKRNGFYIALYGSLAIVLVLAAVISFDNLSNAKRPFAANEQTVDLDELEQTSHSTTRSYLAPDEAISIETDSYIPDATRGDNASVLQPENPLETVIKESPKPSASPGKSANTSNPNTTAKPEPSTKPGAANTKPETKPQPSQAPSSSQASPAPSAKPGNKVSEADAEFPLVADLEEPAEPVFKPFASDNKMEWPVLGEVVMGYSTDHVIYDKTLEQYRTNDNICIAAELGSQVKATAEGVVKSVTKNRQKGNTVVIDNGNGWTTVYSELQDGVLVKEGDVVKAGQVIGGVGNPSIYSVLLGNHLSFSVMKNDKPVDPMSILNKRS